MDQFGEKTALVVELSGFEPFPGLDQLVSEGEFIVVTDQTAALAILAGSTVSVDLVLCNSADSKFWRQVQNCSPNSDTLLYTNATTESYLRDLASTPGVVLDHVVGKRRGSQICAMELAVTIRKIFRRQLFGIAHYLEGDTPIQRYQVTGSDDRETLNYAVKRYCEHHQLGQNISKLAFGITEELLMNVIYDAPLAGGRTNYQNLPRTSKITLETEDEGELRFGCDGHVLAIGVSDPFGALTRAKLHQYLSKVLVRRNSVKLIDTKKLGAGLGLFKILYSSHSLICNVAPREKTEMIALIETNQHIRDFSRMTRSIHYFSRKADLQSY